MRSPVLAFSIIAATVSPTIISAAPIPSNQANRIVDAIHVRDLPAPVNGLTGSVTHSSDNNHSSLREGSRNKNKSTKHQNADQPHQPPPVEKRTYDGYTAGGNAHSGGSANASGGSIGNFSEDPNDPQINTLSNTAGSGSVSATGDGAGGNGDGFGPGGNGSSGNSGPSRGGDIVNAGRGGVTNTGANTVGTGGFSGSGDASGGNAGMKRAFDYGTAGGNAYSGSSSSTSSGSVSNVADPDSDVINNADSNIGPDVLSDPEEDFTSESFTGEATGGNGDSYGPGGNAYSGNSGPSNGGFVFNNGDDITNTEANTAPDGGVSDSGAAFGGNAAGPIPKRAYNDYTAGGNAVSGNSGVVNGGSVINSGDPQSDITNTGGNDAGDAGTSFSGTAVAGDGRGRGPGGNAYSGYTGSTRGGNVVNSAGTIENTANSNNAGDGNANISGDAYGGDAGGIGPFVDDDVDDFNAN